MQPSSGTMREVRQCGMISPRQSGRMSWVAWKKRFWKSRCSFIFFYFLNLCKKNFKQLNLKKIQTNFDAGPASPACFYSEIIKSIFKCFSEVDLSERNRASWFLWKNKRYTALSCFWIHSHGWHWPQKDEPASQQGWGHCHSHTHSDRARLGNGKNWLDVCFTTQSLCSRCTPWSVHLPN